MSTSRELNDLLTLPQVAEELRLHRATVNDMVLNGRLKGVRLGAQWVVRREDVERFGHTYSRPKNSPRRRSRKWSDAWKLEIVRWLHHWTSATTDELDRVIDLHIGNIRKYLTLLEQDDFAERDDEGYWHLTDSGKTWAMSLPPIPTDGSAPDHSSQLAAAQGF